MLGSLGLWGQVAKYAVLALVIGGATWWFLHKLDRAAAADRLEVELAGEKAARTAEREFGVKVDALRRAVDTRMVQFLAENQTAARTLRERLIREVPAGNPCFSVDTIRLLNAGRIGGAPMPGTPGDPVAPATATPGGSSR